VSGRTSLSVVEQVRQANDIVDVISAHVSLRRAGRGLKGLCPFHKEKTPSFTVAPDKQIYHCFGCGAGGDVFKFIQQRENVGFSEALAILAARAGITLPDSDSSSAAADGPSKVDLERINRWASRWFQDQLRSQAGQRVRQYLVDRGISRSSVEKFGLGFAPESWGALSAAARADNVSSELLTAAGLAKQREDGTLYDAFRNRLMFPICDAMNRVLGFGGRTLGDDSAKYLNSPQNILFDKSRCLFGIATAREAFAQLRRAVVVEGYTDCILCQQHGFVNTVATLGTALTPEHVRSLHRYVDEVVLVFDSDEAGRRAADNSLQLFLTEQLDVKVTCVPGAKDPAELLAGGGDAAFEAVLTSATDALEFKWNQVQRRYQTAATRPDRRRAVEEFLELIARSAEVRTLDPIQRGLILNQVGKLLGLSGQDVGRQLDIVARRLRAPAVADRQAAVASAARTSGAGATAMQEILEVLLNEPDRFQAAANVYDPELLAQPDDAAIAKAIAELAQTAPAFTVSDVIGRFESVRVSGRVLALQVAGEQRGNYAATMDGAVQRLNGLRELQEAQALEARLRAMPPADAAVSASAEERSVVEAAGRAARGVRQFAARKHLASPASSGLEGGASQRVG